jgi:branched-chain amino acid transport system substrate-binding protein
VNDINNQGGVLGGHLTVTAEDDKSTPSGSTACATDLVSNKAVPAIIGSFGADVMDPALAVTVPANVAYISDITPIGDLTTPTLNGLVFSTSADHALQGGLLAERVFTTHGLTKCAIIKVDQPATNGWANGFSTKFTALGGSVVSTETITTGQNSYASTLQAIYNAGAGVQCIMLSVYATDAVVVMQNYLQSDASNNTFWVFPPTLNTPAFQSGVGASNFTFSHEGIDTGSGPGFTQYNTVWTAANPTTTLEQEPGSYDDVYLLALAIEYAGTASGQAIKDSMRDISNAPGTVIYPGDWGKAVSLIHAGTKIEYQGATGIDSFDANGQAEPPYIIWQFKSDGSEPTVCSWNADNSACL